MSAIFIATGSYDRRISIWDAGTGRLNSQLNFGDSQVNCLAVSPDRSRLAAGGFGAIKVFNVSGASTSAQSAQAPVISIDAAHQNNVTSLHFIQLVAVSTSPHQSNPQLQSGDTSAGSRTPPVDGLSNGGGPTMMSDNNSSQQTAASENAAASGAANSSSYVLCSVSEDCHIKFFPVSIGATGAAAGAAPGGGGGSAGAGPGNATGAGGGNAGAPNAASMKPLVDVATNAPITCAAVFPDQSRLVTGSQLAVVTIWDLRAMLKTAAVGGGGGAGGGSSDTPSSSPLGGRVGGGAASPPSGPMGGQSAPQVLPLQQIRFPADHTTIRSISIAPLMTFMAVATNSGYLHFLRMTDTAELSGGEGAAGSGSGGLLSVGAGGRGSSLNNSSLSVATRSASGSIVSSTPALHGAVGGASASAASGSTDNIAAAGQAHQQQEEGAVSAEGGEGEEEGRSSSRSVNRSSDDNLAGAGGAATSTSAATGNSPQASPHVTGESPSAHATANTVARRRSQQQQFACFHSFRAHQKYILRVRISPDGKVIGTASADYSIGLWRVPTPLTGEEVLLAVPTLVPPAVDTSGSPHHQQQQQGENSTTASALSPPRSPSVRHGGSSVSTPTAAENEKNLQKGHSGDQSPPHSHPTATNSDGTAGTFPAGAVPPSAGENSGAAATGPHGAANGTTAAGGSSAAVQPSASGDALHLNASTTASAAASPSKGGHGSPSHPSSSAAGVAGGAAPLSANVTTVVPGHTLTNFVPLRPLQGHQRWVWDLVFSSCSSFLLSVSSDHTGRLWDLAKEKQLTTYTAQAQKPVVCVVLDDRTAPSATAASAATTTSSGASAQQALPNSGFSGGVGGDATVKR